MNYEPNTRHWKIGDFVIHDADAKSLDMLMRVTGYTRDGLVKTVYHYSRGKNARTVKKVWRNDPKYLHDPARFGIVTGWTPTVDKEPTS